MSGKNAESKRKIGLPVICGALGGLILGAVPTYLATATGLIPAEFSAALGLQEAEHSEDGEIWLEPSYVTVDPMVISLGPEARARHLRLRLKLEVVRGSEENVEKTLPRIFDALNVFLRVVDERDIEFPEAMSRLRVHMLRRVQTAAPPGAVTGLLIQEFVLS